jgi:hypothetical protein
VSTFLDLKARQRKAKANLVALCVQTKSLRARMRQALQETIDGMPWADEFPDLVPVVEEIRAARAALDASPARPQTLEQVQEVLTATDGFRSAFDHLVPVLAKLKDDPTVAPDLAPAVRFFHNVVLHAMGRTLQ